MIRQTLSTELETALLAGAQMGPAATRRAGALISDLKSVKKKVESRAAVLGYSERCRRAIQVCGGECCIWHFPKTLTAVDFFIAVFGVPAEERQLLVEKLKHPDNERYQCPLLKKNGCIFTFENRPIVCTNAFPCLAGQEYWQYKEKFREDIKIIYTALGRLIRETLSGAVRCPGEER